MAGRMVSGSDGKGTVTPTEELWETERLSTGVLDAAQQLGYLRGVALTSVLCSSLFLGSICNLHKSNLGLSLNDGEDCLYQLLWCSGGSLS